MSSSSTRTSRFLLQSTVIVIVLYSLNKVTGLVRLRLVGNTFGTSAEFDAFTAANQLPELFYVLLAGGALAAALIPVYSQFLTHRDNQPESTATSSELAGTVFALVIGALTVVCGFAALFSPWIVRVVLLPASEPEMQQLTAELMRIILLNTMLFGVSGVITSLLNAHQHFILPALAPIALDIGYIASLYTLVPDMGVHGLAWGTVLGAILHISIQLPGLWRYRVQIVPRINFALDGVSEILRLMAPRLVTLGTIQLADVFWVRVSSDMPPSTISGYGYAFQIMQLPETLFGTAIAIVAFPTMSQLFNTGDIEGLKNTAMSTLRIVWLLTIPSAVAIALIGREAIGLLLEGGAFDAASTAVVYTALLFMTVRIVSEATLEIVARLFYARHNTFVPMLAYLVWLVVNVLFIYLLAERMGVAGIALASTIAFTVLAALLYALNRRELGNLQDRAMVLAFGRSLFAAAVMGMVIVGIKQLGLSTLLFLPASVVVGGLTYLAVYWLIGGRELAALFALVRRRG